MFRIFLIIVGFIFCHFSSFSLSYYANEGQRGHRDDFEAVLPFVWNEQLDEWGKSVTDNLDRFMNNEVPEYGGLSTYQYLSQKFGVKCKVGDHRAFFHWGYQRKPWCEELLRHLPESLLSDSVKLEAFKKALVFEQQRRNRITNAKSEEVLGFGSTGRQARYANAFVTIIYDVHILGDYETKTIDGLAPVSALIAELSTAIRNIDGVHASNLTKELRRVGNTQGDERKKAYEVLSLLREKLPSFIASANDGVVDMRFHFEKLGFKFRPEFVPANNTIRPISAVMMPLFQDEMNVAVTRSGKYHKTDCSNLQKAKNPTIMTITEAKKKGIPAAKCCFR